MRIPSYFLLNLFYYMNLYLYEFYGSVENFRLYKCLQIKELLTSKINA